MTVVLALGPLSSPGDPAVHPSPLAVALSGSGREQCSLSVSY